MKIWGITDTGLIRRENQDAFMIRENTASGCDLCVVCDGMGGPAGGRMASSIAVTVYLNELESRLREGIGVQEIRDASLEAVALANGAIRAAAGQLPEYHNMGTTLVSAIFCPEGVVITNVGDSRAYYLTPDTITSVTKDHSLVQDMVDRGDITPEQALHHPQRNVITRALGPFPFVEADAFLCVPAPESWFLLCSDGLVNTVSDQEILEEVRKGDGEECLRRLVSLAKDRGAPDNVTAVLTDNR